MLGCVMLGVCGVRSVVIGMDEYIIYSHTKVLLKYSFYFRHTRHTYGTRMIKVSMMYDALL